MAAPQIDVAALTLSRARVYYADLTTEDPSDTLEFGDAWGNGWTFVGMTSAPTMFGHDYTTVDADAQDFLAPIKRGISAESGTLETTMAEVTAEHLQLAHGGAIAVTDPAAGQPGKKVLTVGGSARLKRRRWGVEGYHENEDGGLLLPIRAYMIGTASAGGNLEFDKTKYMGIPLKVPALANPANSQLLKVVYFTAPAVT